MAMTEVMFYRDLTGELKVQKQEEERAARDYVNPMFDSHHRVNSHRKIRRIRSILECDRRIFNGLLCKIIKIMSLLEIKRREISSIIPGKIQKCRTIYVVRQMRKKSMINIYGKK